jgi:hypothetical protein
MLTHNINKSPSPGNSQCGYIAAPSSDPLETLRAGLAALARRYAGEPVHGDILRMAAQVERLARAGAR